MTMERWRPSWGLGPWDPFREMAEMSRRFDDVFRRPLLPAAWRRFPLEVNWAPPIEILEKEDRFMVKAELPGMKKEEIDISLVGNNLTIKGERKAETETKEEDYYCCERSYGSFLRSIALPSNVDAKKIEASYEDGILEVNIPKTAEVKPQKVSVSGKKKEVTSAKKEKPKAGE